MNKIPSIVIFDIGKTNKKMLLFGEQYSVLHEESVQLEETTDEDGFACEDVHVLTNWVKNVFERINRDERFDVKAVNFSAYGASFVYVDKHGKVIAPLYNYLRPYPEYLKQQFYHTYGGESLVSKQTASPVLGSLNSGMQLYRLKYQKPELFQHVAFAFHLPQYLSYILAGCPATDITSIGCHTNLWNFNEQHYHRWVKEESFDKLFATIMPCTTVIPFVFEDRSYVAGAGLHDSSSALIPYLTSFNEPFILLSTGTWSISLNPFNHTLLTDLELHQDCLCFLSYKGSPVKASRLFAGYEHEQQTKRLAAHFNKAVNYYTAVSFDEKMLHNLQRVKIAATTDGTAMIRQSHFAQRDLSSFAGYEEAYHQLIADIIEQQVRSTKLVLNGTPVKRIFVDGGFSKNTIYMYLLAAAFPGIEVYAATVAQASALGAALAVHDAWNSKPLPADLIGLKLYTYAGPVA